MAVRGSRVGRGEACNWTISLHDDTVRGHNTQFVFFDEPRTFSLSLPLFVYVCICVKIISYLTETGEIL